MASGVSVATVAEAVQVTPAAVASLCPRPPDQLTLTYPPRAPLGRPLYRPTALRSALDLLRVAAVALSLWLTAGQFRLGSRPRHDRVYDQPRMRHERLRAVTRNSMEKVLGRRATRRLTRAVSKRRGESFSGGSRASPSWSGMGFPYPAAFLGRIRPNDD